jgi:hypothetical protein
MWWIVPDAQGDAGVRAARETSVRAGRVTLPPWAIAVLQAPVA